MTKNCCSTVALLLLFSASAAAQPAPPQSPPAAQPPAATPPAPDYPVVRVGVVSYLQYNAELENRDGFNSFDVTRAYLNVYGQISKNFRFRFTPDIRRVNDSSLAGTLVLRVKYAYAQLDRVTPGGWIKLGLHQTPWLDFEQSINRYRVQGTMFSERDGLIPGSSDFGASYFTPLPGGYGEIHGGVFNGEGYTLGEANKYKSAQIRATLRPLPNAGVAKGFRVSGFYNAGWYAADRPRRLGIVMGSYEHPRLVATVQALRATERPSPDDTRDLRRQGWSAFVEPRQGPAGLAALLRYDAFDPDNTVSANEQDRIIAGGAYWFVWPRARVGLVVTNERVRYDSPSRADENRLLVQTHIEF
jgi:hypothetical protein